MPRNGRGAREPRWGRVGEPTGHRCALMCEVATMSRNPGNPLRDWRGSCINAMTDQAQGLGLGLYKGGSARVLVSALLIGWSFPLRRGVAVSTTGVAWALMRYRHQLRSQGSQTCSVIGSAQRVRGVKDAPQTDNVRERSQVWAGSIDQGVHRMAKRPLGRQSMRMIPDGFATLA